MTGVAIAVALVAALSLAPPPATAHPGGAYWTLGKVRERVDGIRVPYAGRRYRIHREYVACWGEGRGLRRKGRRVWAHFTCMQYLVNRHRDLVFRVHVLSRTRFRITDVRLRGGY